MSEQNANPDRLIYSGHNLTLQFDAAYLMIIHYQIRPWQPTTVELYYRQEDDGNDPMSNLIEPHLNSSLDLI